MNSAGAALGVGTSGTQDVRLSHDPWREVLSVASRGSARQRARYPRPEPTEHTRGETLFSQAPRKTPIRPSRDHHR